MKDIILYSTHCPKCNVLERKLRDKGISYTEENSIDKMLDIGIMEVPVLSVDGNRMDFTSAVQWVNNLEEADEH